MQTSSLNSIVMYGCASLHPLLSDAGGSFFKDDWPPVKHDLLNELSRGLAQAQTWSLNGYMLQLLGCSFVGLITVQASVSFALLFSLETQLLLLCCLVEPRYEDFRLVLLYLDLLWLVVVY